ncbi:GntR family transcriptional regulator [Collinsella stercoris]|uniref:GntR family transcriptional regulator n=1 Tax=Collinsella stercoris TaxID=147206 RepID=UPI0023F29A18|nr:GntR family transcriptional regulator [Collinsella stercoris]
MWYIKSEGLKGGDRLMPERELAEKLGVSRTALRAAITQLISTHVLESRQGSGTYVLPPKPINIFQETYNYSDAVRRAGREPGSRLEYARLIEATRASPSARASPQAPRCSRYAASASPTMSRSRSRPHT